MMVIGWSQFLDGLQHQNLRVPGSWIDGVIRGLVRISRLLLEGHAEIKCST
jgi:hypothetical protein